MIFNPSKNLNLKKVRNEKESQRIARAIKRSLKNRVLAHNDTLTKLINTGTSTKGPMTVAKASLELIPKTPIATAIANSKLLLAAVNESVAVSGYVNFKAYDIAKEIANMIRK